jgi:hypothetical protein
MMAVMLGCAVGHTSRINFLILPENVTWIFVTMIEVDLKNIFPSIGSQLLWLQLLPSTGKTSNKILFLLPVLRLSVLPLERHTFFLITSCTTLITDKILPIEKNFIIFLN